MNMNTNCHMDPVRVTFASWKQGSRAKTDVRSDQIRWEPGREEWIKIKLTAKALSPTGLLYVAACGSGTCCGICGRLSSNRGRMLSSSYKESKHSHTHGNDRYDGSIWPLIN